MAEAVLKFAVPPEVTPESVARRVMEEAGGDLTAATAAMVAEIERDAALYQAIAAPLIQSAAHTACARVRQAERAFLWQPPERRAERERLVGALAHRSIFAWQLSSGKRLGEATREELLAEAKAYRAQAGTALERAGWLERIAERLPDGALVETLGEQEVERLKTA